MITLKEITILCNIIMSGYISAASNAAFGAYDRYIKNKRRYRRRLNRRQYRSRMYKGRTGASLKSLQYLPRTSSKQPLPDCYHTRFIMANSGYIASGTSVQNITTVMNTLTKAFDGNSILVDGYNIPNPTITPITDQVPTGLIYLMPLTGVGPYTKYTVMSSFIKITVRTTNSSDVVQLVCVPLSESVPCDIASISGDNLAQQPKSKVLMITGDKGGVLKHKCDIANYLGVSKRALKDDLSGTYDGAWNNAPANKLFWGIKLVSKTGAALAGNVTIDIKQWFNVCLWNDANGIFPTVDA